MQLLGLAWLQLCIVLICICFIRSGLYQEYIIDNSVQLCILMHMYWATELLGNNVFTDRRPEGEVSKHVTSYRSAVVYNWFIAKISACHLI